MDIQKYTYNQTKLIVPISSANGQSQDQAVILGSEAKYMLITIENEFISAMLDEGNWKKVGQSLIQNYDKNYDKITIHHFF